MAQLSAQKAFNTYPSNMHVDTIVHNVREGYMVLNPPYQRPSVWTEIQKRLLIHSLINNFGIHDLTLSERFIPHQHFVVIDGKQRIEALCDFFDNQLAVPREWFHTDALRESACNQETITFSDLSDSGRRAISNISLPITICHVDSAEDEAQIYHRLNSTGTAHTEAELLVTD